MTEEEARIRLSELAAFMEGRVDNVVTAATDTQKAIYDYLTAALDEFDTKDGKFDPSQPLTRKILAIERKIYEYISRYYNPSVLTYLSGYDTIDERIKYLHQEYNQITVTDTDIKNVRLTVYDQTERYLTQSLADAYVQPAKFLLMQTITNGKTIQQAKSMLNNWNDGQLPTGTLSVGVRSPRLQAYAGQMARDGMFQYNGTIQDNLGKKHNLKRFLYVGGLVRDSRPFCRHLVGLKRKIELDEVPKLVQQYPDGLYENTTKENFPVYRGGYNCIHNVMMVK